LLESRQLQRVLCVIDDIDIHYECYTNGDDACKAAEVILDKVAY